MRGCSIEKFAFDWLKLMLGVVMVTRNDCLVYTFLIYFYCGCRHIAKISVDCTENVMFYLFSTVPVESEFVSYVVVNPK